jgi:hypothetical protein
MSWLFFLDESGHDHKRLPFEVRGGIAVHASKLWSLILAVKSLEQSLFGGYLHEFGSEIKGSKLLAKDRFKWEKQGNRMEGAALRAHALNFLNASIQGKSPRRDEFTAFGQACIRMADGIIDILRGHNAKVFASMIPCVEAPPGPEFEYPRKDTVFLLERYFYFLNERREMGLLVMDGSDKHADRRFMKRVERYFADSATGKHRTRWIVPAPFFVESDMAYGVQIADLCIYCVNWGYRNARVVGSSRSEIEPFAWRIEHLMWRGRTERGGKVFDTESIVFVPDPYTARRQK